jgi:hypothetical protein
MLDPLRGGDEARIAHFVFRIFLRHLVALGDQSFHPLAFWGPGRFVMTLQNLLEPFRLPLGLLEMLVERR